MRGNVDKIKTDLLKIQCLSAVTYGRAKNKLMQTLPLQRRNDACDSPILGQILFFPQKRQCMNKILIHKCVCLRACVLACLYVSIPATAWSKA
jgi:hypothetical protein